MKQSFLLFLFIVLAVSCSKKEREHLPPAQMQAVLYDVHLAEVYSIVLMRDSNNRSTERNPDSLAYFYKSVLHHHNITWAQFEESLKWYEEHPEELDSIYNRMIPEMSKLEGKYGNP